jgi:hypothetical protein
VFQEFLSLRVMDILMADENEKTWIKHSWRAVIRRQTFAHYGSVMIFA